VQRLLPHHDFAPEPRRDGPLVRAHYRSSGYAEELVRLFERGALGSRASEVVQRVSPNSVAPSPKAGRERAPGISPRRRVQTGHIACPLIVSMTSTLIEPALDRGLHAISKACRACASARVQPSAFPTKARGGVKCHTAVGRRGDDWSLISAVAGPRTW
jgi:hypothetical protein